MAHNIATINGEDAIAYAGESPWHRLGTHVDDDKVITSVPHFLEAANLDWDVELLPVFYTDKAVSNRRIELNSRAVVRITDRQLLSTVSADYQPLQNADAFEVLQPAIDTHGLRIEVAGALGVGDRVWMLAKLPHSIEVVKGDELKTYMLVMTGHNGWTAFTARLTQIRAVCENTLSIAQRDGAFCRLNHVSTSVDKLAQVAKVITEMVAGSERLGAIYQKMAQTRQRAEEAKAYVERVLQFPTVGEATPTLVRRRDKIVELGQTGRGADLAPETLWSSYNGITEYVDHVRPTEVKAERTIRAANTSAVFGANAALKARALTVAQDIVAAA